MGANLFIGNLDPVSCSTMCGSLNRDVILLVFNFLVNLNYNKKLTLIFFQDVDEKLLYDTFSAFGVIVTNPKVLVQTFLCSYTLKFSLSTSRFSIISLIKLHYCLSDIEMVLFVWRIWTYLNMDRGSEVLGFVTNLRNQDLRLCLVEYVEAVS